MSNCNGQVVEKKSLEITMQGEPPFVPVDVEIVPQDGGVLLRFEPSEELKEKIFSATNMDNYGRVLRSARNAVRYFQGWKNAPSRDEAFGQLQSAVMGIPEDEDVSQDRAALRRAQDLIGELQGRLHRQASQIRACDQALQEERDKVARRTIALAQRGDSAHRMASVLADAGVLISDLVDSRGWRYEGDRRYTQVDDGLLQQLHSLLVVGQAAQGGEESVESWSDEWDHGNNRPKTVQGEPARDRVTKELHETINRLQAFGQNLTQRLLDSDAAMEDVRAECCRLTDVNGDLTKEVERLRASVQETGGAEPESVNARLLKAAKAVDESSDEQLGAGHYGGEWTGVSDDALVELTEAIGSAEGEAEDEGAWADVGIDGGQVIREQSERITQLETQIAIMTAERDNLAKEAERLKKVAEAAWGLRDELLAKPDCLSFLAVKRATDRLGNALGNII